MSEYHYLVHNFFCQQMTADLKDQRKATSSQEIGVCVGGCVCAVCMSIWGCYIWTTSRELGTFCTRAKSA